MSAEELVNAIDRSGGMLALAEQGRLRYRLPAHAGLLLHELRRMKPEIIAILRRKSFLHLVPFLGKRVWTPSGSGKLVAVQDYVTVEFEGSRKVRWNDSAAVIPYA